MLESHVLIRLLSLSYSVEEMWTDSRVYDPEEVRTRLIVYQANLFPAVHVVIVQACGIK